MHPALMFLGLWMFAFVSLCLALLLVNIYSNLIDYDFGLHGPGKEAIVAGICSLIEGASVWVVVTYLPAATRALIVPALLVCVIYLVTHLEDWNRIDPVFVLVFQFVIGAVGVSLFGGHFVAALIIIVAFVGLLAFVASIVKGF